MAAEIYSIEENTPAFGSKMSDRLIAGVGSLALLAGAGTVAYFDPVKSNVFPVCPLLALTGFACPGCGLTRGFHALFHGDLIVAIDFNALILVWAAIIGWSAISLGLVALCGRGLYMWPTRPRFLTVFAIALVSFGVMRNLPYWPLTILYP